MGKDYKISTEIVDFKQQEIDRLKLEIEKSMKYK